MNAPRDSESSAYSTGNMKITRTAYDDTGASIIAGATGVVDATVPEPSSMLLAATAIVALCGLRRRG